MYISKRPPRVVDFLFAQSALSLFGLNKYLKSSFHSRLHRDRCGRDNETHSQENIEYYAVGSKNSVCFNTSRAGSENSDSGEASTRIRPLHEATATQHRDVAQYDRGTYKMLVS